MPKPIKVSGLNSPATMMRIARVSYGSIYPSVVEMFNHWFCVGGNGYAWIAGELAHKHADKSWQKGAKLVASGYVPSWSAEETIVDDDKPWMQLGKARESLIKGLESLGQIEEAIKLKDELLREKERHRPKLPNLGKFEFYPLVKSWGNREDSDSILTTFPSNIKPAWRNCLKACCKLIIRTAELNPTKRNLENKGVAERTLIRLERRVVK